MGDAERGVRAQVMLPRGRGAGCHSWDSPAPHPAAVGILCAQALLPLRNPGEFTLTHSNHGVSG